MNKNIKNYQLVFPQEELQPREPQQAFRQARVKKNSTGWTSSLFSPDKILECQKQLTIYFALSDL